MDDQSGCYTIGELSKLTGLAVGTIRFYSDEGVVPEAGRTPAGYRSYRRDAVDRLGLVRTLRDLGIDLATIRRVLEREVTMAGAAEAHAAALDLQIRTLRMRRSVLRAVAAREAAPRGHDGPAHRGLTHTTMEIEEVELMNKLTQLSDAERRRMVDEFLDDLFGGLDVDPGFEQRMRSAMPDLPPDPSTEQVEAWVELAELIGQPEFRRRARQMAQRASAERAGAGDGPPAGDAGPNAGDMANLVATKAGDALAAGMDPASADAEAVVAELVAPYAQARGTADGPELRRWILETIDTFADRRVERYWQLLGLINGWPPIPSVVPAWEWFAAALRAERP